ncbi:MAG TPA: hypothetical protein VNA23_01500 [Anaerolineales bacterium]|nr:hypothetical protein [Anaerolineales bacterium]
MKKLFVLALSTVLLLTMAGCGPDTNIEVNTPDASIQLNTPGVNPLANQAAENGRVAGVIQGLWHGIISPVTLVMSFVNENVQMYEVHNVGREYNLGYLLGVAIVFLLLGFSGRRR